MARSVLLVNDQNAGRYPDRCVLSGVTTNRAVHATAVTWAHATWLLGIPALVPLLALRGRSHRYRLALPVAAKVWHRWHRRNMAASCAVAAGIAFVAVGVARGDGGIGVLGGIAVFAAGAYRTRVAHNYWVTCTLDPARGTITVRPTHTAFDDQARRLFDQALHRR